MKTMCMRQILCNAIILSILTLTNGTGATAGDSVPVSGPRGFHTADPTVIEAKVVNRLHPERFVTLRLPRSSIVYVSDYPSDKYSKLPTEIVSKEYFVFAIVAPEGTPLGEAVERKRKAESLSVQSAMTKIRPLRTMVEVSVIGPDAAKKSDLYSYLHEPRAGTVMAELPLFDGLKSIEDRVYRKSANGTVDTADYALATNDIIFFPADSNDLFDLVVCANDNRKPIVFCDYYKRVSDLISLKVKFVDFRYNGGRAFLNERMLTVLRKYCEYDENCNWSPSGAISGEEQ